WTASVVTGRTSDTEPCIIFGFEDTKYIINTGENSNRAFCQKSMLRNKTRAILYTQLGIPRCSGLASMFMASADQLLDKLDVIGPPGIIHYIAAMRFSIIRDSIRMNVTEVPVGQSQSPSPLFQDENISIYGISITPNKVQSSSPEPEPEASSLTQLEALPDFSPTQLEGRLAHDWRRRTVDRMFPALPPGTRGRKRVVGEVSSWDIYNLLTNPWPKVGQVPGSFSQLPKLTAIEPRPTVAYVVMGERIRGKFDVEKSNALRVPRRLRKDLTMGQSVTVTFREGDETITRVVRPEECLGPSKIPTVAVVLDIPTPSHIAPLLDVFNHSQFYSDIRSKSEEYTVQSVFHLCGKDVLEDTRYIEFINSFPADTNHIITSPDYDRDPVTFHTTAFHQLRMNRLDPEMFPLPKFSLKAKRNLADIPGLPSNSFLLEPGLHMGIRPVVRPAVGLPAETPDLFHPAVAAGSTELLDLTPPIFETFEKIKLQVNQLQSQMSMRNGHDVAILPLGTVSSAPGTFRNGKYCIDASNTVSSVLVRIPGWGSIILDAGEGTWGQLARQFGVDGTSSPNVWDVLRDLKCIFVSHMHGDHHLGVANILTKRRQLNPPPEHPLYLVAVHTVHLYLRELSDIEDLGFDDPSGNGVVTVICDALHRSGEYSTTGIWKIEGNQPWAEYNRSSAAGVELCRSLGLRRFQTIDVYHRVKAYGLLLEHQDGWSIVYSGDTLPTRALVYARRNATVLIHEATMGDDEADMAQAKGHSTVGQAILTGRQMRAKNVLLTHFSARYNRVPPLAPTSVLTAWMRDRDAPMVAYAFDHANMTIGTMWKMNIYFPVIREILDKDIDAMV
ncbi:hypothetical protein C8J57DRAFT_1056630, partial [Mycena rebaudengoi]